jgi:enamine deaminase RidA (YjgF/YER057c/UK114 family)
VFQEIFGDDGVHSRAAVGVSSLPLGSCVEIDAIAATK